MIARVRDIHKKWKIIKVILKIGDESRASSPVTEILVRLNLKEDLDKVIHLEQNSERIQEEYLFNKVGDG